MQRMPCPKVELAEQKHLILFFDVNDTMFIGDSAKAVDKTTAILKLLAENYSAVWDKTLTDEIMTFREFIEKKLCPGKGRDSEIQKARNILYGNFISFLEQKNHPLLDEIKTKFHIISASLKDGYIPSSFIHLLNYLEENKYKFTIIFRTFGKDIKILKEELARRTSLKPLDNARFQSGELVINDNSRLNTPEEILAHIKPFAHAVWQDCYEDWQSADETYAGGKPFPIDFDNENTVAIFFDDNVHKQIISAQPLVGDYFDQKYLQTELIRLGRIVPVNTFKICMDNNYYIQPIEFAYKTPLKLSQYLPLSENSTRALDEAIYCWAMRQLNPDADLATAKKCFDELAGAYNDNARYFHRGLGHPRSLLPAVSQLNYKSLLRDKEDLTINTLVNHFDNGITNKLSSTAARIQEAQEIIAAFYHDVVHRNGNKPKVLDRYTNHAGAYQATQESVPVTHCLLGNNQATKAEEQSCIVAEEALTKLNIDPKYITPILLAIYNTIPFAHINPFTDNNHPDNIKERLNHVSNARNLIFSNSEIYSSITVATEIANRDLGSYGDDSLDEFNKKSWAMMLERNANLANPQHTLADEADTIAKFYDSHKKLYKRVMNGEINIYHSLILDKTTKLNHNAMETIKLDIILQGVQLASLAIMMAILSQAQNEMLNAPINIAAKSKPIHALLNSYESSQQAAHFNELPAEVVEVLMNHGKNCSVNGVSFMRGSDNATLALRFAGLVGLEALLKIADLYVNSKSLDLPQILNPLGIPATAYPKPTVATQAHEIPRNSTQLLQQFGSFKQSTRPYQSDTPDKVRPGNRRVD